MTEGLPKGLITTSEAITEDIEAVDHVAIEDITQLWKVYTTNRVILADDVGRRLENFFWRIWSNGKIQRNITGSQVAALFSNISEGNAIRNTPTQSPRSSRSLRDLERENVVNRYKSTADEDGPASLDDRTTQLEREKRISSSVNANDSSFHTQQSISESQGKGKQRDITRPPPILKKPRAGSSTQIAKSARILTPTWKSSSHATNENYTVSPYDSTSVPSKLDSRALGPRRTSLTWKQDEIDDDDDEGEDDGEAALSFVASSSRKSQGPDSKLQDSKANKPARKKPAYLASTGSNKHRPSISRRKSSQSPSSNASKSASPRLTGQTNKKSRSPPPLPLPETSRQDSIHTTSGKGNTISRPHTDSTRRTQSPRSTATLTSAIPAIPTSPQSSVPSEHALDEVSNSSDESESEVASEGKPHQDWLVDKDFRSKFVDKFRSVSGTLRSIAPKSTAATMIPNSFQASGKVSFAEQIPRNVKGKTKESHFTDEIVALKPPGATNPAIADDDSPASNLPRTKSQLTLLLEKDKRKGVERKSKERESRGKRSSS